jgi:hypothetical protein
VDNPGVARHSVGRLTPRQSIAAECARRGRRAVIEGCARLVRGDRTDTALIRALGGPAADKFFDGAEHHDVYWFRVWGARGLLWEWDDSAADTLLVALRDESWRVREMALRVTTRHLVGDALDSAAALRDDPVPRVREAARRAVVALTGAGA